MTRTHKGLLIESIAGYLSIITQQKTKVSQHFTR